MLTPKRWAYLVLVGAHAEVLESLTGVLGSTEQEGVASSGSTQSQLIQSQALTASGNDASTSGGGESHGSDCDLGDLEQTVVISDGTDNDNNLILLVIADDLALDAGEGNGRSVDAGHKQATQNDLCRNDESMTVVDCAVSGCMQGRINRSIKTNHVVVLALPFDQKGNKMVDSLPC
jgi:hypothetical protein